MTGDQPGNRVRADGRACSAGSLRITGCSGNFAIGPGLTGWNFKQSPPDLPAERGPIERQFYRAAIAKDATMIEAFRQGTDIHSVTASKVFGVFINAAKSPESKAMRWASK